MTEPSDVRCPRPPPDSPWLLPVPRYRRVDWRLVVQSQTEVPLRVGAPSANNTSLIEHADTLVWIDDGVELHAAPTPSAEEIDELFQRVSEEIASGGEGSGPLEVAVRQLILALMLDLRAAMKSGDATEMWAAVVRAREVELPDRQRALEMSCTRRLEDALALEDEAALRQALSAARSLGCEHLPLYAQVRKAERGLYRQGLAARLEGQLLAGAGDISLLAAVRRVAAEHGFGELEDHALWSALHLAGKAYTDFDLEVLVEIKGAAESTGWEELQPQVEPLIDVVTMERGLVAAATKEEPSSIAALRAIEQKAKEMGRTDIAVRAASTANVMAERIRETMGLPASWDVVQNFSLLDNFNQRLLKKTEENERSLLRRMQQLVDVTYSGWGGLGKLTRTRDRAADKIPTRLEVRSVVYVQNAEAFVSYRARRQEIVRELPADAPTADVWDVKTARVSFAGVGRHTESPVNPRINEYYLWHGTNPEAACGITDTEFDVRRAGTAYGMLYGPGIYLAESCMKADEYTRPDRRGWYPLVLCRTLLGKICYCDTVDPIPLAPSLEADCRRGGRHHSVLGDREKVRRTFREFVVYDSAQVYPEYIVWYARVM